MSVSGFAYLEFQVGNALGQNLEEAFVAPIRCRLLLTHTSYAYFLVYLFLSMNHTERGIGGECSETR